MGKKCLCKNSSGKFKRSFYWQNNKRIKSKKIKLNITAVYTARQTKQILKSIDKKTKLIISIFAGRAADTGKDPIPEFKKSIMLSKKFKNVEILWASVREPLQLFTIKTIRLSYYYYSTIHN